MIWWHLFFEFLIFKHERYDNYLYLNTKDMIIIYTFCWYFMGNQLKPKQPPKVDSTQIKALNIINRLSETIGEQK